MTALPVDLAIPCRLVTLQVRMGPEAGMTTLEGFVARAILLGRTRVSQIAELFAVPDRMIIDVVASLWGKGQITVDLDTGVVDLSVSARETLARTGALAGADEQVQPRKFLFEPISGMIFIERHGVSRPGEGSIRMPLANGITETDIPRGELVRAVQSAVREDRRQGIRANVLDVSFGNPVLREPTKLRWLPLQVQVRHDLASGRIWIGIDNPLWGATARQRLRSHIANLAETEPDLPFVQKLKGRADVEREAPERLDDLMQRMSEKVDDLAKTDLTQVRKRQDELRGLALRIQERLAAINRARAAVTLVRNVKGHEWAAEDLIDSARSQLLIATPTISYQRLNGLLPNLRKAVERGVRLVIMWGRAPDERLPTRVQSAFDELNLISGSRVMLPRRSSRTDACIMVQDDDRALVGSNGPLSGDPPGDRQVSVLVEPADDGPRPVPAVVDLLIWARQNYPYWREGRQIKLHRHEFDPDADPEDYVPQTAEVPLPGVEDDTLIDAAAVRLWAQNWAECRDAFAAAAMAGAQVGAVLEVVEGGDHVSAFWEGLRHATRQVVIADDTVSSRAVDAALISEIRARRQAGAAVLLLHPALPANSSAGRHLAELEQGPERVALRLGRPGSRVLVSDDKVLIGSFSPLAGTDHPAPGLRRSQLGVHIQDQLFAAELARALGASAPADHTPPSSVPPPAHASTAWPVLRKARAAPDGAGFGECVVESLREAAEPWRVLDIWNGSVQAEAAWDSAADGQEPGKADRVPDSEIRTAAAALFTTEARQTHGAEKWARWLVSDAWQRRSFVEAALLGRLLFDHRGGMYSSAVLAASLEAGPLGAVAGQAAYDLIGGEPGPSSAGAAGALGELLFWAGSDGLAAIEVLTDSLPPAWQGLVAVAVRYVQSAATGPLPLEAFVAAGAQVRDRLAMERQRADVIQKIDKLKMLRTRFNFDTGTTMHNALFSSEGLLNVIRGSVQGDAAEVAHLRTRLPTDVRRYLDELIAAARELPMEWHKQVSFLRSMEDIVRIARELADASAASGNGRPPESEALIRKAEGLARYVAGSWDTLFAEATASVPAPYGQPMLALLDKLYPLARWAWEHE
jgi:hypothetical protein